MMCNIIVRGSSKIGRRIAEDHEWSYSNGLCSEVSTDYGENWIYNRCEYKENLSDMLNNVKGAFKGRKGITVEVVNLDDY